MSTKLYVYFKPNKITITEGEMIELINVATPNLAKMDHESSLINLDCKWISYMNISFKFPYWNIFFWCYWDEVLNGMELRQFVKNVCEAVGTNKWWWIEETSMDIYNDMSTMEFEHELEKAVGIENFSLPSYFPHGPYHIFADSSIKVALQRTNI